MNTTMPTRRALLTLALAALGVAALLILAQVYLVKPSALETVADLRYELGCRAPDDGACIDTWMWEQRTPYKYRLLGRMAVYAVYEVGLHLGADRDHAAYRAWLALSWLFNASTLFLLALLLRGVLGRVYPEQPPRLRTALVGLGWLLFLLSPPILYFSKYPVRGAPNDLLGYSLMLAALLLLARRRIAWFCAVSTLAVFCRETTLLVPFAFLFFDPLPLRRKLLPALLPVAVLGLYRAAWPGAYDALAAGLWLNLRFPVETACYVLITFGPLWVLGATGCATLHRMETARGDPFVGLLVRSFVPVLLLACTVSFLFASLYEMRILYMLFPYLVPFAVIALYENRRRIAALLGNRYFLFFAAALLIEALRFWFWMRPLGREDFIARAATFDNIVYGFWDRPQYNWIDILTVSLFATLACLPLLALLRPPGKLRAS